MIHLELLLHYGMQDIEKESSMKKKGRCCFCNVEYDNYGNDIRPLITTSGDRCCDKCNVLIVIPNRIKFWFTDMYMYVIKNRDTGEFINEYGLGTNYTNIADPTVLKFKTEEDAQHHIDIDQLFNCEIVRLIVREDD